jgi:hypothetical protein
MKPKFDEAKAGITLAIATVVITVLLIVTLMSQSDIPNNIHPSRNTKVETNTKKETKTTRNWWLNNPAIPILNPAGSPYKW